MRKSPFVLLPLCLLSVASIVKTNGSRKFLKTQQKSGLVSSKWHSPLKEQWELQLLAWCGELPNCGDQ